MSKFHLVGILHQVEEVVSLHVRTDLVIMQIVVVHAFSMISARVVVMIVA